MDITTILLGSEIALSLYPQLIKLVPTTIEIQTAVRFITYSILSIIGVFLNNNYRNIPGIPGISIYKIILMGVVNIVHIFSSYYSFKTLSSGFSYSLFYLYPIFNFIGRSLFNNEYIKPINYLYILTAIIGVYYVYYTDKPNTIEKTDKPENTDKPIEKLIDINPSTPNLKYGIIAGVLCAFTETLIYFMVRNDVPTVSPFIQIIKTYLLGGIFSIIYIGKLFWDKYNLTNEEIKNGKENQNINENVVKEDKLDLSWEYWLTLILFNCLIGFLGYVFRFFTIPKLSTIVFNSLIFIGVIFAYIWGWIFSNEIIQKENIIGSILILLSVFLLNK